MRLGSHHRVLPTNVLLGAICENGVKNDRFREPLTDGPPLHECWGTPPQKTDHPQFSTTCTVKSIVRVCCTHGSKALVRMITSMGAPTVAGAV